MSFKKFNAYFARFITEANDDLLDKETQKLLMSRWKKAQPALKVAMNKKPEASDTEKPKSYKTAYIMFCQDKRASIIESDPELKSNPNMVLKKMGQVWSTLAEKEKKKYEAKSEKDKKRYKQELEEYYEKYPEKKPDTKEKPKSTKPKNAYQLFCEEVRPKLKEEGLTGKAIQSKISLLWAEEKTKNKSTDEKPKKKKTKKNGKTTEDKVRDIYEQLQVEMGNEVTLGMLSKSLKASGVEIKKPELKSIIEKINAENEESDSNDEDYNEELDEEQDI